MLGMGQGGEMLQSPHHQVWIGVLAHRRTSSSSSGLGNPEEVNFRRKDNMERPPGIMGWEIRKKSISGVKDNRVQSTGGLIGLQRGRERGAQLQLLK